MVSKLEREYQMELIPRIYDRLPGEPLRDTIVIINDPNYIQGIPDLSVFHRNNWAMLEVKMSEKSPTQPNQAWYVSHWGQYIFTAFIYPENEAEVLYAMEQAFRG